MILVFNELKGAGRINHHNRIKSKEIKPPV
jgi:hypothetical protein